MNNLKAIKRDTVTSGQLNKLRESGFIPAVLYGGKDPNAKISIEKKLVKNILNSESFLSKVLELSPVLASTELSSFGVYRFVCVRFRIRTLAPYSDIFYRICKPGNGNCLLVPNRPTIFRRILRWISFRTSFTDEKLNDEKPWKFTLERR